VTVGSRLSSDANLAWNPTNSGYGDTVRQRACCLPWLKLLVSYCLWCLRNNTHLGWCAQARCTGRLLTNRGFESMAELLRSNIRLGSCVYARFANHNKTLPLFLRVYILSCLLILQMTIGVWFILPYFFEWQPTEVTTWHNQHRRLTDPSWLLRQYNYYAIHEPHHY